MRSTGDVIAQHGDASRATRWASITKLATALATLIAVEEGAVDLDEPAGPPGSTVRHLLAHAGGYAFESDVVLAAPATRRIYFNTGYEAVAEHVARRTNIAFPDYLHEAVLRPLGIAARLEGTAAAGLVGTLDDLVAFVRELLAPTLLAPQTLALATSVAFPGIPGVLPGFGPQVTNDWGLGFELRDAKRPHWMGGLNSPSAHGHFGGAGTFVWIDKEVGLALACLTDREFGPWAAAAWPAFSDSVIGALR